MVKNPSKVMLQVTSVETFCHKFNTLTGLLAAWSGTHKVITVQKEMVFFSSLLSIAFLEFTISRVLLKIKQQSF